jgi:alkylation response protein AidB-like acyl-CoA dehydrogenase
VALSELHEQIAREARRHAEAELEPLAAAIDAGERAVPLTGLADLGLLAPDLPADVGGAGADPLARELVIEALARSCASTALAAAIQGLAARLARRAGDPSLAARLAALEERAALAFSEGPSGEDSLEGAAVFENGRVRGAKNVLGPAVVERLLVLAREGDEPVLLSVAVGDVSLREEAARSGLRGLPARTVVLDAPAVRLGRGDLARVARDGARALVAAVSAGIVARGLEEAKRYAMMRQQFGRAIAKFQGVQFLVAQIYEAGEGCRALAHAVARAEERGELPATLAAACALEAPGRAVRAALDVVQVFGGMGYTREVPAERLLRDALTLQALAGAVGAGAERTLAAERLSGAGRP